MAYSPDYFGKQYQTWKGAKDYERSNPNLFKSSGLGKVYGDALVQNQGLGGATNYVAKSGPFGAAPGQDAQGFAKYRNDYGNTNQFMTEFGGYLERNKGMKADAVLNDLAAGNVGKYESYVPEFTDWRGRETTRGNATGMMTSTLGKLVTAVGPALVTGGAALPLMGRMGAGAAFGGMAGGPMGALTGGIAAGIAPNIKLPGIKTAVSAPMQAAKSVASQLTPANLLRLGASQGIGAAAPKRGVANYLADPNLLSRIQAQLGGRRG
jgi:hypothetical protein